MFIKNLKNFGQKNYNSVINLITRLQIKKKFKILTAKKGVSG